MPDTPFIEQLRQVLGSRPGGESSFRRFLHVKGLAFMSPASRRKAIARLLNKGALPNKGNWRRFRQALSDWGAGGDEIARLEEAWQAQHKENRQPRSRRRSLIPVPRAADLVTLEPAALLHALLGIASQLADVLGGVSPPEEWTRQFLDLMTGTPEQRPYAWHLGARLATPQHVEATEPAADAGGTVGYLLCYGTEKTLEFRIGYLAL